MLNFYILLPMMQAFFYYIPNFHRQCYYGYNVHLFYSIFLGMIYFSK